MSVTKFEEETGLERLGNGRFEGIVSPDWSIVRGANGGHLAAILLRAMQLEIDDAAREPRSLTVHFARIPRNESFGVEVSVEREGRTVTNVSARMKQGDKLIALAVGLFSTARTGPAFADLRMPEVQPPEAIEPVTDREDFPFGRQFDFRRAHGPEADARSDTAELGVWLRLREPTPIDHIVATQLLDAFAPAVFAKLGQGGGGAGVPTVEMTYHYRAPLPPAGSRPGDWYLGVFRTQTARDGFIEEDGWLWDRDGDLLAQSRQLALLTG